MKKARSRSSHIPRSRHRVRAAAWGGGFTLVELLVSMTVLVLIIAMLAQVVQNTTSSIQRSTKGMDNNQLSTIALDRIGNSIAGMLSSGQATLVAIKNSGGSDGMVMLTNARVRSRVTPSAINVTTFTDIRLGARGFCIINTPDPDLPSDGGGTFPSVPMLSWGDGTITWSPQNLGATQNSPVSVQGDPLLALSQSLSDTANKMGASIQPANMLQFSELSRGICRLEICFLLSDGTLVSAKTPPLNKHLISGGTPPIAPTTLNPVVGGSCTALPLAFNSQDSNYPSILVTGATPPAYLPPLFVRGIVVGIASLDIGTQKLAGSDRITALGGTTIFTKTQDGQTPSQAWDLSPGTTVYNQLTDRSKFPPPVLQNIRFTQRYFYVN